MILALILCGLSLYLIHYGIWNLKLGSADWRGTCSLYGGIAGFLYGFYVFVGSLR